MFGATQQGIRKINYEISEEIVEIVVHATVCHLVTQNEVSEF